MPKQVHLHALCFNSPNSPVSGHYYHLHSVWFPLWPGTRRHEDSWAWVGRLQKMLPALGKPSKTPAAAEPERLEKAKKQRRYFANKDPSSQSSGFSSGHRWIWELDYKESWAPKNWYFWNVVLGEDSWVPWTAKRSNQSILKDISPEYSLEGLMLKLKLQYFGHLMRGADSLEKMLMLEKIEGRRRRREWQRMRWLDGVTNSVDREAWYAAVHGITEGQTQLKRLNNDSNRKRSPLRIIFSQGDLANNDSVVTGTLLHF